MIKFICYPKCTTCQRAKKWLDENKIGAEIPFTRYFYKYQSPKSTEQIKLEFQRLEKETKELENGLFDE